MSQHIYTYDASNDQLNEIGGAGHIIKDAAGTTYTKRENLQFEGATVTDDPTNNGTIVSVDETNFVGTLAQWNALTLAQKAKYKTVDLTDDFNGDPIDATPTANSLHAVQSGGTYTALAAKANASDVTALTEALSNVDTVISENGAKNLCPNTATDVVRNGITWTVNDNGTIHATYTATANSEVEVSTFSKDDPINKVGATLILSGCPSSGAVNKYFIYANTYNRTTDEYVNTYYDVGESVQIQPSSTEYIKNVYCKVINNQTVDIEFRPMLTLVSQPNSDYAHYVPYAMTNRELTEVNDDSWVDGTVTDTTKVNSTATVLRFRKLNANTAALQMNLSFNQNISIAANTSYNIATIPEGFRPKENFRSVVICISGYDIVQNKALQFSFSKNGPISVHNGTAVSDPKAYYVNLIYEI